MTTRNAPAAVIRGIGTAVPLFSVNQQNSVEFARSMLWAEQPGSIDEDRQSAMQSDFAFQDNGNLVSGGLGLCLKPGGSLVGQTKGDRQMDLPSKDQPGVPVRVAGGRGLEALYRMSSVKRRGSVLLESDALSDGLLPIEQSFYPKAMSPDERGPTTAVRNERFALESLPLALEAAQASIVDASIDATAITHLIVVTCTGFFSPGIDVQLIQRLGLSDETQRVQVGFMGCHGAINAMRVAQGLVAADRGANVLLVCVELCTLHYQYGWETDRVVSNAIFADGAAAMVFSAADDQSEPSVPRIAATGSKLIAGSEDAMSWKIGDHGFEMTLSAEVPGIIETHLEPFLSGWLARHQMSIGDIAGWAVHPGGPRILRSVQSALQLTDDDLAASRAVLANHGNMSSPTMIFILERFFRTSAARPWLMIGFGPGLEVEIALVQ